MKRKPNSAVTIGRICAILTHSRAHEKKAQHSAAIIGQSRTIQNSVEEKLKMSKVQRRHFTFSSKTSLPLSLYLGFS